MKLESYLQKHRLTMKQFAQASGAGGRTAVQNYVAGIRFPTPLALWQIREATKGAVTADDFLDQWIANYFEANADGQGLPVRKRAEAA